MGRDGKITIVKRSVVSCQGITIIIPCFNEQLRIPSTLSDIDSYAKKHPRMIKEVICVDDGSSDGTAEWVMRYADKLPIKLIRHEKNEGKWAAVGTGLRSASGLVLLLDADGSASVWELETCGIPERKFAVFGTRYGEGASVSGKSFLRSIVSWGYRVYVLNVYALAGGAQDIGDFQAPFKLFHVEDLVGKIETKRFSGDIELALRLDAHIINHPLDFHHVRGSTVPIRAVWNMFIETARIAHVFRKRKAAETIK